MSTEHRQPTGPASVCLLVSRHVTKADSTDATATALQLVQRWGRSVKDSNATQPPNTFQYCLSKKKPSCHLRSAYLHQSHLLSVHLSPAQKSTYHLPQTPGGENGISLDLQLLQSASTPSPPLIGLFQTNRGFSLAATED